MAANALSGLPIALPARELFSAIILVKSQIQLFFP
jgi:hypothetical protein